MVFSTVEKIYIYYSFVSMVTVGRICFLWCDDANKEACKKNYDVLLVFIYLFHFVTSTMTGIVVENFL